MKGGSVLKIVIVLIGIVFILNQIVSSLYSSVKTDTVYYHTIQDGLSLDTFIIRNEILVESNDSGVMHFVTLDGNRVAKNGVIADIYDSENASITVSAIEDLTQKIADIKDILSYNDIEAANLDLVNARVDNALDDLIFNSSSGNFQNFEEKSQTLLSAINRRHSAMGNEIDFSSKLESLEAELQSKKDSLTASKGQIKASESGYFVSKTDGFEKAIDISNLDSITPENLRNVKTEEFSNNVIGKIVSDYEWYIASEVTLNQSLTFKEGDSIKMLTNINSCPELNVTVKKINISENDAKAVIIFACSDMNNELASIRTASMTAVKSEYSGYRIPKKALRVVEGQRGVYVLSGMEVSFKEVEIVYTGDNFILCSDDPQKTSLKLYDQVVVKGKDLYDGKIVD